MNSVLVQRVYFVEQGNTHYHRTLVYFNFVIGGISILFCVLFDVCWAASLQLTSLNNTAEASKSVVTLSSY